jgi:RNA polymerase sigma factor (TIGR02999 family)
VRNSRNRSWTGISTAASAAENPRLRPDPRLCCSGMSDVTHILNAIEAGEAKAGEQLLPLVYDELRKLAAAQMAREKPGQTLDATALVHEAWLRLVPSNPQSPWENRRHFFAAAATAMRRILIDRVRQRRAQKRGGDQQRQELDDVAVVEPDERLLALEEALVKLAARDPLKARLVELRFFGELTGEQAAKVLGISPSSADRHWIFARAWLHSEIQDQ